MRKIDDKTMERLSLVHPELRDKVLKVLQTVRLPMRVTDGLRSWSEQERLYAKGRTAPGKIVTKAKPGYSFHNFGLAVDCCFIGSDPYLDKLHRQERNEAWQEYGEAATSFGLVWGGNWKSFVDMPHIQLTYGLSLASMRAMYKSGGMSEVWIKIDKIAGREPGTDWMK